MRLSKLSLTILAAAALLVGCSKVSPEPNPNTGTGNSNNGGENTGNQTETTFKVGDFYNKGFIKGIVVFVDESGKKGKVISLDETTDVWSYKYEEPMFSRPSTGRYNTDCIYKMDNWKVNYPGFYWCSTKDALGLKKWYIPGVNELHNLYKAYTGGANDKEGKDAAKAKFNKILQDNGGTPVSDAYYWTSEECSQHMAYAFNMRDGSRVETPSELDKQIKYKFRAMADF